MNLRARMTRLEATAARRGMGRCRLCYGHPFAVVIVVHEPDSDGPGFRETGDCYLAEGDEDRVTDGLCCRACGARAVQAHLVTTIGTGPAPKGRRLCVRDVNRE